MLRAIWNDFLRPLLGRPPRFQVAALCHRAGPRGREVLLVTSRETRRWVLPKGWPKRGLDAGATALEEAWEEAGIDREGARPVRVGTYLYDKRLGGGLPVPTEVAVFAVEIEGLFDEYPEAGQRERRWMTPDEAADAVDEPGLKDILRDATWAGAAG